MSQTYVHITAYPLGWRIISNTELKYLALSGLFPEILTEKVCIQEPLRLLVLARSFRLFQSFVQVLVSAYALFMASVYGSLQISTELS